MNFLAFVKNKIRDMEKKSPLSRDGRLEEDTQKKESGLKLSLSGVIRVSIFVFLCAISVGVTLFFTGSTAQGIIFDRYAFFLVFSLLAFVVWILGGVYFGELHIKRTPLDLLIFFFWLAYGISAIFSVDSWHSFFGMFQDPSRGFIVLTASLLLYYVVVNTQTRESLYRLAGLYVAGISIFSLWSAIAISGIFQNNVGILSFFNSVPINTFFSLNLSLTFSFPLLLAFFLHSVSVQSSLWIRIPKIIVGFVVLTSSLYVIASLYLFVALIALFFGLGIFISYTLGDIVRVSKQWTWLPMSIFFIVLPVFYFLGQGVLAKEGVQLEQSVLPGLRASWEAMINTLAENPLLGTGANTYMYAFSHYFPESLNGTEAFATRSTYGQNYLFEMVTTTGLLGGVTFFALLVFSLSITGYLLTQRRGMNSVISLGLWASMCTFILLAFFYGVSGAIIFSGIWVALLSIAILLNENGVQMKLTTLSLRAIPKYAFVSTLFLLVACMGTLAIFSTLGKMYVADVYAQYAIKEQTDEKKAIKYIEKSIQLNPNEGQYYVFRGRIYLAIANKKLSESKNVSDLEGKDIQEIQSLVAESVQSIIKGRDISPKDIFAQEALIQVLDSLGRKEDLYNVYGEAREIEPKNPVYPLKMAEIRIAQAEGEEDKEKRYVEAENLLDEVLSLKQNDGEIWYQKALLWEGRNDLDRSVEFAKKSREMSQDIRYGLLLARLYQVRDKEGDLKESEKIFEKILSVNNKEVNAYLGLAGIYEKTGRFDKAIDQYEKAKNLVPVGSDEVRNQLEEIIKNLKEGNRQQQIQEIQKK